MKWIFFAFTLIFLTACNSEKNDAGKIFVIETSQSNNLEIYSEGERYYYTMKEMTEDRTEHPDFASKIKQLFASLCEIDSVSGIMNAYLEGMKMDMFRSFNEELHEKSEQSIISYDYKIANRSRPMTFALRKVKYTGGTEILATHRGEKIIDNFRLYRKDICELIAGSVLVESGQKKYFFKDPQINDFKNYKDLNQQFDKSLKYSNVAQDDSEAIKQIYTVLSKTDAEWNSILTSKNSWIDAFAILVSLQSEVLKARGMALALISSRVSNCGYNFNKILPITFGSEIVHEGDDIKLQVFIAAFFSEQQPEITIDQNKIARVTQIKDGIATITAKATKSKKMTISGTITIRNKSGVPKTEQWSKEIEIIP